MNEGSLSGYIKNELKIKDYSCHLVVPYNMKRSELKYLNFKVRALKSDVDLLLRKDSWPDKIKSRMWKTGYERRKFGYNDNESPKYKPNFRRT